MANKKKEKEEVKLTVKKKRFKDFLLIVEDDGEPYRGPEELPYLDDHLYFAYQNVMQKSGFAKCSDAKKIVDEMEDIDYSLFGCDGIDSYVKKNPSKYDVIESKQRNGQVIVKYRPKFKSQYYSEGEVLIRLP